MNTSMTSIAAKAGGLTPPLKWHGGKQYLAARIVALMPPHIHYVEPYFGGGAVLLAKEPDGVSEVVNDVNRELTNFWRVLQIDGYFDDFTRLVEATPFSEVEFDEAVRWTELGGGNEVSRAWRFFIRCRQSLAGRMKDFAPLSRTRTRRGMNEQASAWLNAIEGLSAVHARLKRVAILCGPAIKAIEGQDGQDTLHYCDPPYVPASRSSPKVYEHEMTIEDHAELIATLQACKGKVLLSGYANPSYDNWLADWNRHDFGLPNNSAGGKVKKRMIESIWCNF